jgi:L,D-transpeptidase YcbB
VRLKAHLPRIFEIIRLIGIGASLQTSGQSGILQGRILFGIGLEDLPSIIPRKRAPYMLFRQMPLIGMFNALACILVVLLPCASIAASHPADIPGALVTYLEAGENPDGLWIGNKQMHSIIEIATFYRGRGYSPIWVSPDGPGEAAKELAAALGKAEHHGLSSRDYHYHLLSQWLKIPFVYLPTQNKARDLAGLEIALSDAFINFGNHLSNGRVDPVTLSPQWVVRQKKQEILDFLGDIRTAADVRAALQALAPHSRSYLVGMAEADRLRQIIASGGWPAVPTGKTLRKGDRSSRLISLRRRLIIEGTLSDAHMSDDHAAIFDGDLEKAVLRFQYRHGLVTDGAVGRNTLAALNRCPEDLLKTVMVNLERLRWVPPNLGDRYLLINVAAFLLDAFQDHEKVLEMRIIVGEEVTQTPTFSKDMAYLVFNPYWNVPHGILEREILPKIKKDPAYIAKNHFELIKGWKEPPVLVDPATIDWSRIHADNFPGRLRQTPGPWNSLGRIKFIFPNQFSVYLHDTPERHLFRRPVRTFSSGCIRVEKPVELAAFVLGDSSVSGQNQINDLLADGETTAVPVQDDVTVHLVYWTFWAGEGGDAHFRADVYDRDRELWKALHELPGTGATRPPRVLPDLDPNVGVGTKG